ncbi:MAG: hypothetical protein WBC71_15350, partial [Salaquimonas sp.]
LVVFGIAIAVFMVHFLANTSERLLQNEQEILEIFALDNPTDKPGLDIMVTADHRSALFPMENPEHQIGLVEVMGSKHLTRLLSDSDITTAELIGTTGLYLHLTDFTLRDIRMIFVNSNEVKKVALILRKIGVEITGQDQLLEEVLQ